MNQKQKEEGVSIQTVLIVVFLISIVYYISGPIWHGTPVSDDITITRDDKTITITSNKPMVLQQHVKEVVHSSGWGAGIGMGAAGAGACGNLIPGYSRSKSQLEPVYIIKIFKLD